MHVRRALALALAVPLLLAGCTDDPEPTPKIPDPTTSSPTDEPTETETPAPESAVDFIRRWQATSDEMQRTGETAPYLDISSGCRACMSLADNVADIYDGGGSIEFAGSDITHMDRSGTQPPTFDVDLRVAKTVIRRKEGDAPETLPAGEMSIRVTLKRVHGDWTLTHYGVL
jgi:hypothetical protein